MTKNALIELLIQKLPNSIETIKGLNGLKSDADYFKKELAGASTSFYAHSPEDEEEKLDAPK